MYSTPVPCFKLVWGDYKHCILIYHSRPLFQTGLGMRLQALYTHISLLDTLQVSAIVVADFLWPVYARFSCDNWCMFGWEFKSSQLNIAFLAWAFQCSRQPQDNPLARLLHVCFSPPSFFHCSSFPPSSSPFLLSSPLFLHFPSLFFRSSPLFSLSSSLLPSVLAEQKWKDSSTV